MAVTNTSDMQGYKNSNDLSAKRYYIVKQDTSNDGYVVLAAAATDPILGVLQNDPKAGETAVVKVGPPGDGKVIAGGTIHNGDKITSDSNGKAVATTTAGDNIIGVAVQEAVTGDIFRYRAENSRY